MRNATANWKCEVAVPPEAWLGEGPRWDAATGALLWVDILGQRVHRYDPASGTLGERRPLATVDVDGAVPDGMAVDAEGCLWVALHGGWGLNRYSAEGQLLTTVRLPVANVTSCCFGGPELRDLYVTTRREILSDAELAQQPLAGALLRLDPGVAGLPTYAFAG